jgi:hypothetical protein
MGKVINFGISEETGKFYIMIRDENFVATTRPPGVDPETGVAR